MLNIFKCIILFIFIVFAFSYKYCKENVNNVFIIEYFLYRSPSTVVGFTCNHNNNDIKLIKMFSTIKFRSTIWKLEKFIDLSSFANSMYYKLGVFIDLRCQDSKDVEMIFNEATNYKMFDELYYWLILGSDLNESLSLIIDDSFGLSTNFVVAIFKQNKYILYDIYNPCKLRGGKLKIVRFGIWNENSGLHILLKINKINRWNLQGMNFKLGGLMKKKSLNKSLTKYLHDYNFNGFDLATIFGCKMWKHLSEMFNFSLEFQEYIIGNCSEDNSPVIRALIDGEIDASGTADLVMNEQIGLVKDVYQAFPFRTFFIFRSTSLDKLSVGDILHPLSSTVWYLTIGLSILSVHVFVILSVFMKENIYEKYFRAILVHISAFCQQGIEFSPNNLSRRVAILHILFFNLLLYNYYLASSVCNRLSKPIMYINDSLNELSKKNFEYASEPIFSFNHYIKSTAWETRSFYVNKWLKIPESQRFITPEKGMALVLKGDFAYHTSPEISYSYIGRNFDERKICELQEVHLIKPIQLSIFISINSSFTEMLKTGFIKLTEVGIRYRQIQIWTAKKPKCRSDLLTADSLKINEVAQTILFLIFCSLTSGIIFIIEFLFSIFFLKKNV